jgi:hypothetical protein
MIRTFEKIEVPMKPIITIYCLIFMIVNIWSQANESTQQKSLDDVIVKETFEAGEEEEKLPINLKADFSNLVEIKERIHWSSISWTYEGEKPTVENFTGRLPSPELTAIAPEPAKVFFQNFEELASWKIDIFKSDGQKFRSLGGEGKPPKSIAWHGRGDDDTPLTPGESYAYSFTAIDRAGNRRTLPGGAFSVPALYLKNNDEIWIGISYASIFSPHGYGLAPEAENLAFELVNFIYYFYNGGTVQVESDHPQTDDFLAIVAKNLGKEIDFFQRNSDSNSKGKCFVMRIN